MLKFKFAIKKIDVKMYSFITSFICAIIVILGRGCLSQIYFPHSGSFILVAGNDGICYNGLVVFLDF